MYQQQRIEAAIKNKNQRIDTFVDRREKSIAYFNSLNSAISFVAMMYSDFDKKIYPSGKEIFKEVCDIRDKFYMEWQNWYMEAIAPSKDKPSQTSPAAKKRILNWVKEDQGQEHNFNKKEAEINQEKDNPILEQ